MRIESLHNQKIKDALKLFKKNVRDETGLFIIEGYRELLRAYENDVAIKTLFYSRDHFLKDNEDALIEGIRSRGAQVLDCKKEVFEKLSYRDRPDGLFAVARQRHPSREQLDGIAQTVKDPFLVVVERIEKPGNLGTILRTADGVGADAVIVCDPVVDVYNPNVVRASVGTLFSITVFTLAGDECLSFLKENGIRIVATSPEGEKNYFEADLTGPIAVVFGAEQYGLSPGLLKNADLSVRIPMSGTADSLNVSASAAVMLYEVYRQRHHTPGCSTQSVEILPRP